MAAPVSRYRLAWDPLARRGEVAFLAGGATPVRIPVGSADEFNALALMLKEPGVAWDGRILLAQPGGEKLLSGASQIDLLDLLETNQEAKKVIDVCEDEWPANKGDCSGFVKDVAASLGMRLSGQANDIVDQITGPGWTKVTDGKAAKQAADEGKFVVGGLKGGDQQTPSAHGHVVVVVAGPLAKDQYPTAYWGTLGGVGERAKTINWAWKATDRDNVSYAFQSLI
jgi:hypothetical protein